MSKSNHQKHGFHPLAKWQREFRKDFVSISKIVRHHRWNGTLCKLLDGKIGSIEGFKFYEIVPD